MFTHTVVRDHLEEKISQFFPALVIVNYTRNLLIRNVTTPSNYLLQSRGGATINYWRNRVDFFWINFFSLYIGKLLRQHVFSCRQLLQRPPIWLCWCSSAWLWWETPQSPIGRVMLLWLVIKMLRLDFKPFWLHPLVMFF